MYEIILVKNTFDSIYKHLKVPRFSDTRVIKVWEDNKGALKLDTFSIEKVTPLTKHFAIKYHWFHEKLPEHNIPKSSER